MTSASKIASKCKHCSTRWPIQVDEILVVDPKDVQVLAPSSEYRLTLVTCYPCYVIGPAPKRFIVRALAADTRVSAPAPS